LQFHREPVRTRLAGDGGPADLYLRTLAGGDVLGRYLDFAATATLVQQLQMQRRPARVGQREVVGACLAEVHFAGVVRRLRQDQPRRSLVNGLLRRRDSGLLALAADDARQTREGDQESRRQEPPLAADIQPCLSFERFRVRGAALAFAFW